ncbi:MAG: ATP-dependent Clp protease ATP-binding subunit [Bacteroidia bacterium]|nr:ATP-dependent Clp protease ATP-binding subunit [Bacteroidia bacterium]
MKVKDRSLDNFDDNLKRLFRLAVELAETCRHEYLTIEHIAFMLVKGSKHFAPASFGSLKEGKRTKMLKALQNHLDGFESVPENFEYELEESYVCSDVHSILSRTFEERKDKVVNLSMFVAAFTDYNADMCFAAKVFHKVIKEEMASFMVQLFLDSLDLSTESSASLVSRAIDKIESDILSKIQKPAMRGEIRVLKGPAALEMLKKELQGKAINIEDGDDSPEWEHAPGMQQVRVDIMYPFGAKSDSTHKTYCREVELDAILTTLMRRDRNNIILVGEAGVGKTQMGFAILDLINSKECPEFLKKGAIFEMNLAGLLTGVQMKQEVDARVMAAMNPFVNDKAPKDVPVIIFIDDVHSLMPSPRQNDGIDIFGVLAPFARQHNIHFIVTASYEDYNKLQGSNKVVDSLFHKIEVKEPSVEDTKLILSKVMPAYAKFHNVSFPSAIISEAVDLAQRHIGEQFFPAKAIDLLDEAAALMRADFAKQFIVESPKKLKVSSDCLQRVIAIRMHKEKAAVGKTTQQKYSQLLDELQKQIYGQDSALNEVVNSVLMGQAGLEDETKPIASLFFVGPTGVGKTEVAKALANQLEVPLIRFDMSEFAEAHTVAKLIGSPAGYVGYDEGGLLTNAVRKSPSAVVLFDEIEKAHKDIYNILLQVMDYASLTDGKGVKASFRNTIIIFTSNAGAQFAKQASLGFASRVTEGDAMLTEVKKVFKPEFINRLSRIVVFNGMDKHMASLILDSRIKKLQDQVAKKNVTITFTDAAKEWLLNKGYTPEYGAREMDRAISQHVKAMLSREILFGALTKKGAKATIDVKDDKIVIQK